MHAAAPRSQMLFGSAWEYLSACGYAGCAGLVIVRSLPLHRTNAQISLICMDQFCVIVYHCRVLFAVWLTSKG